MQRIVGRLAPLAALLFFGVVSLTGCAGGYYGANRPVQSAAVTIDQTASPAVEAPVVAEPAESADGSLWHADASLISMFSDQKARRVGDVVTIKIAESSAATNKASTATDRESSLSASLDAFFNAEKRFPADQPFFNPFSKVAGGLTSEFEGTGTTKRSGNLDAFITAVVTRVLPNGNLVITGTREVLINNENQVIQLTGVVRPRDIGANNQVMSTYIADARIAYSGTGVVNDRQRPGWLSNIMMAVWPF
jgi:flagellar L-ring protein precursor FlgH